MALYVNFLKDLSGIDLVHGMMADSFNRVDGAICIILRQNYLASNHVICQSA